MDQKQAISPLLLIGDVFTIFIVSLVGFVNHNSAIDWHIFTTLLPMLAAWSVAGFLLGVYKVEVVSAPAQLWRVILAVMLAAPVAAWLRAIWLDRAVIPVFALVLGLSAALGLVIWRLIWIWLHKRVERHG
jgi:hypothetical protein